VHPSCQLFSFKNKFLFINKLNKTMFKKSALHEQNIAFCVAYRNTNKTL